MSFDRLEDVLDADARRTAYEITPELLAFFEAAKDGTAAELSSLLDTKKFDVNCPDPNNEFGNVALFYAVSRKDSEGLKIVDELLKADCIDVNHINKGRVTILQEAMRSGNDAAVIKLLDSDKLESKSFTTTHGTTSYDGFATLLRICSDGENKLEPTTLDRLVSQYKITLEVKELAPEPGKWAAREAERGGRGSGGGGGGAYMGK